MRAPRASIELGALRAGAFLIVENERYSVSVQRSTRGSKDALSASVHTNCEACVARHDAARPRQLPAIAGSENTPAVLLSVVTTKI